MRERSYHFINLLRGLDSLCPTPGDRNGSMLKLVYRSGLKVKGDEAEGSGASCVARVPGVNGYSEVVRKNTKASKIPEKPPKQWSVRSLSLAFVRLIRFCSLIYRKIFFWRMLSVLHRIQPLRFPAFLWRAGKLGSGIGSQTPGFVPITFGFIPGM